jgi:hypothetical protein
MNDRRRTRRRRMPFTRSAVLQSGGRSHIVTLTDLSADGAFLATRMPVDLEQPLTLRVVVPRARQEMALACDVVRHTRTFDSSSGQPAGIAVRFKELGADERRRVAEFSAEGFLPKPDHVPADHYEYRILKSRELAEDELNRLGLDGWELSAALPAADGVQLVLLRRL